MFRGEGVWGRSKGWGLGALPQCGGLVLSPEKFLNLEINVNKILHIFISGGGGNSPLGDV